MEIDDFYQEIILDHYKSPRHAAKIPDGAAMVDEENPTCGDHIKLNASVAGGKVSDIQIECGGCAICTASASIMAERCFGRPVAEVRDYAHRFIGMFRGGPDMTDDELGDLVALKGVRKYPLRVKCATMGWHAIDAALAKLGA